MENTHIVARFDKKLDRLRGRILAMGDLVGSQVKEAGALLLAYDEQQAKQLIAMDRKINGMHKDIHTRVEQLIALRQPVALDLRQALLPINIAAELERIGDHAKSTAKRASSLGGIAPEPVPEILQQMTAQAEAMLADVLTAYDDDDIELAADVRARDKDLDTLNKALYGEALTAIGQVPQDAEALVQSIILARGFERIGDHVVNIARHIHRIVTGEDLKASQ